MNDQQTVFVVDDEPKVLKAISRLLRSEGFRTESFGSGREFMRNYNPGAAGCLVLDVSMPEISGLQVQKWLVSSGTALPIIFLTGHDDNRARAQAFRRGAADFLLKPVTAEKLIGCVEKALAQNGKVKIHIRTAGLSS